MQAVRNYELLLADDQIFMKERTLMRLAECCYRIDKISQGLKYLEQLENEMKPRKVYTISLLKGKYKDLTKNFVEASVQFEQALELYSKDQKNQIDQNILGNIQFRLGWALIRSRKDIDRGIENLVDANQNLVDNIDLKIKLSQIFFQEKQDTQRGLEVIKEALQIDPENIEAMLLQGKMFIKEKKGKEAVEIVEKSLGLQIKNFKERPKSSTFFYLG